MHDMQQCWIFPTEVSIENIYIFSSEKAKLNYFMDSSWRTNIIQLHEGKIIQNEELHTELLIFPFGTL